DKESTHQIGPQFGGPQKAGESMAFDVTGGPTDGRIYTRGGHNSYDSIAVFSPPVHVPDVSYEPADEGHTSFTVHANVSLDGGPEVTSCRVEYVGGGASGLVPCDQATPYTSDQAITATVEGLKTQKSYTYQVRVVTSNGIILGKQQEAH